MTEHDLKVGDTVLIWVTGMVQRFEAEVVQIAPLRLMPIREQVSPVGEHPIRFEPVRNWPPQMRLKDGDYIILSDRVNALLDAV